MWEKRYTHTLLVELKISATTLWKAEWRFLRKLGKEPPFSPVIPLLTLCPKDLKSAYYCDTVTSIFTAAQVTIAKPRNKPKCPSKNECIKKMWCTCTMECYITIKKNEIMAFVGK